MSLATAAELELITGRMAAAVTRCTRDLRFAWVSNECAEWIRRPVDQIVGNRILDVLGAEAFLRLLPYFERVLSGETVRYEDRVAYSSIGERWISATYTPTFDSQGTVDGWVAVLRDITAEKAGRAALLERDQQLADEAKALARLNECSLRLWQSNNLREGLNEMLRAVVELLRADKGTVQILDPERGVLTIFAHQGFAQDFLDCFREVSAQQDCACGRAIRKYERVIVEDVESEAGYDRYLPVIRAAGYRAVTSTPLIARNGRVLGVVSTYFGSPHRPTSQQLNRLELYTRQAADFIERCRREEELRLGEERYHKLAQALKTEVRVRTRELEQRNAEVLRQAAEVRELSRRLLDAQDQERRKVARDLHDSAGQSFVILAMTLQELIETCTDSPDVLRLARQTEETVRQLNREIRTASYLLHPPLLDETGLASALALYVEGLRARSGLEITLDVSERFHRLPAELELVLFRLVQECLTNIHKHSGSKTAYIRLTNENHDAIVEIRDSGRGISLERIGEIQATGSGLGIRGMRERVQQFNGALILESNSSGTRVLVNVPVPKAAVPEGTEPLQAAG